MTGQFETLLTVIVDGHAYELVGSYDPETPDNDYEFYDIFCDAGNCLNEGNSFYEQPTRAETVAYVIAWLQNEDAP